MYYIIFIISSIMHQSFTIKVSSSCWGYRISK
nr:MAG TPA: hypothetical protein [Caudoviricetes sp.]